MARIKEKIKQGQTKEITAPSKEGEERPRAQVIDLADLLKQSLARKGGAKPADRKAATTRAKPALRVVPASRAAAKTAAKRKRA